LEGLSTSNLYARTGQKKKKNYSLLKSVTTDDATRAKKFTLEAADITNDQMTDHKALSQ